MGKNKKRRKSLGSKADAFAVQNNDALNGSATNSDGSESAAVTNARGNPLYTEQQAFLSSLAPNERDFYFSSSVSSGNNSVVAPERRAELWMEQAEIGEVLVNKHAWATPTRECLTIFRHFSPIVEIGSGSNAYWARYMRDQARGNSSPTIDVVAYDINTREGGKILFSNQKDKKNRTRQKPNDGNDTDRSKLDLRKGGPEVLKLPELKEHTLFLCYPDEEDAPMSDDEGIGRKQPMSFGWQCLNIYQGTYVIHVGELAVLGDATLNMEQSPWGRSSSSEFQQRLASEFHCIAKLPLPNWLHVRDSISVWKRSEICQMIFVGDDDDEDNDDDEEIFEYRHIPPDEMLPTRVVAPCMAHLLSSSSASASVKTKHKTPVAKPAAPGTTKSKSTNATREEVNTAPNSASITEKEISSTKSRKTTRTEDSPKKNDQKQITKSKRKRERQKRRQLLSENKDEEKKKKETEEKKKRSDYFQLHGKLPPPT